MSLLHKSEKDNVGCADKPVRRDTFHSLVRKIRALTDSLPLATRFNIVILPLLLALFAIFAVGLQAHRKVIFDRQIQKLQNTFANMGHDQMAFLLAVQSLGEQQYSAFMEAITQKPLASGDIAGLQKYLDLAIHNRLVSYAAVLSGDRRMLAQAGNNHSVSKTREIAIRESGKTLGFLVLGTSNSAVIDQNLRIGNMADLQVDRMRTFLYSLQIENRIAALLGMISLLVVTAFLISCLFRSLVTSPLSKCIKLIRELQNKDYSSEIPFQHKTDEIGEIARSLSAFRSTLIELEKAEQEKERKHSQLVNAMAEAERLAYIDELTGLPNRACCRLDALEKFSNSDEGAHFAMIYLDLNDFKKINDTLGHSAGDCLLAEVGKRLGFITGTRENSQVYRWGGDEFVILFDRSNGTTQNFCNEIMDAMGEQLKFGSHNLWPSCSIGVARYPEDGTDFESLMICADLALHKTKLTGKVGFNFFAKELKQKVDDEIRIENELRTAVERKELFLVYQPQIDSLTRDVRGIEALIRWRHPERGVLTPWHFLDVVENSRLAPIVGNYVFNEAFRSARQWLNQNIAFGRISVNLSPQHLKLGTLVQDLQIIMKTYDLGPEYVTVEVLESLLLNHDDEHHQEFISILHKMGVGIELDDFGTGYASLSHLSTLPITGLKIDRSFTNQILTDDKKAIVIQALISLTKLLQIDLVCEGVETFDQMNRIQTFGQCSLQGYLIARPMEFEQMTKWLQEGKNYELEEDRKEKIA